MRSAAQATCLVDLIIFLQRPLQTKSLQRRQQKTKIRFLPR